MKICVHLCPAFASPYHAIICKDLLDALHWWAVTIESAVTAAAVHRALKARCSKARGVSPGWDAGDLEALQGRRRLFLPLKNLCRPFRADSLPYYVPGLAPRALLSRAFSAGTWLGLTRMPEGAAHRASTSLNAGVIKADSHGGAAIGLQVSGQQKRSFDRLAKQV